MHNLKLIAGAILGATAAFIVVLLLISPFITIWSINTLFNTNIDFTLKTYFAVLWLTSIIVGYSKQKSKK